MPKLSSPTLEDDSASDSVQGSSEYANKPSTAYNQHSDSPQPDVTSASALDLYGPIFGTADMLVSSPESTSNVIGNVEFPGQTSLPGITGQHQLPLALQSLSQQASPDIDSGNSSPQAAFARSSFTGGTQSPLLPLDYDMTQQSAEDATFPLHTSSWDNNYAINNYMFPTCEKRYSSLNYDDNNLFLPDTVMPLMSPDYNDFPGRPLTPLSMQDSSW